MGLFERKKRPEAQPPATVQLREGTQHPFGVLNQYAPLRNGEIALYRAVREAVPVLDAAMGKLVRLGAFGSGAGTAGPRKSWRTF